ncbi:MAG: RecQ family ATP-dependent DNA helicase [Treponema sp.]|jgi:ATP-dependent DNA helicase RecQ|nr:RecQ family ATP-dependent DNA helicase [Treponema sp.]
MLIPRAEEETMMTEEQLSGPGSGDPLNAALRRLFGLPYLFPYQRLVVANILEAAEGAGVPLCWPEPEGGEAERAGPGEAGNGRGAACAGAPEAEGEGPAETGEERAALGRQIVILPTGAGKSLCFQLPAMLMEGPTLVIYPILSLMADQERSLKGRGFSPVTLRGGQGREEREAVWEKLRSGQSKFIIANPEVLLSPQVMARLKSLKIVHTVIDEAHCVSEWGESFRPSYLEIGRIIEAAGSPVVTAFTATASAPVLEKIGKYIFGGEGIRRIVGNPDRSNITYCAQGCIARDLAVRDLLLKNQRPAIVFCSSRPGTEKLARYLRNECADLEAAWCREIRFYHAGLSREEKKEVEGWFFHNPEGVLVSTCAYGMGVDKADIRTVIHRDCSPSVEAYLQESGRAGRDGLQSKAVLLWGPDDQGSLKRIESEAGRLRLTGLLDYARDTGRCRREALLKLLDYQGSAESPQSPCCDVCEKEARPELREEASLAGFFRRNKRAYTIDEAAAVLSRAENIRWSGEEARRCISFLIGEGKLKKLGGIFWKNKITLGPSRPVRDPSAR